MITYIKELFSTFIAALKSRYKWIAIFYLVWLYRIEFIPDTGEGMAKVLQVVSLFAIILLLNEYGDNFVARGFKNANGAVKTMLVLCCFAILSAIWIFCSNSHFSYPFKMW